MINLNYALTMNGQKIAIKLEEVGLPYNIICRFEAQHLIAVFNELSPNHKISVIVDHAPRRRRPGLHPLRERRDPAICGGEEWVTLTHGFPPARDRAIMVDRAGRRLGAHARTGQSLHTLCSCPGQEYSVARYSNEARRLVAVFETRLKKIEYLAEEYAIADIARWAFISVVHAIGIDIADYPAV